MPFMDICCLVKEFYAIEAVLAMLANQHQCSDFQADRHSHLRWHSDFMAFREEFNRRFAAAIYDYTALVVAGELRHGEQRASHSIKGYYEKSYRRDEVYSDCTFYTAESILAAGLRLFNPNLVRWEEGFGGEKWYQIAKAGSLKRNVSDEVFIDHCVDLSHNNSVYFDKGAGIFCLSAPERYKDFLDFKRICEPQILLKEKFGYRLNHLLMRANNLGILTDCEPAELRPWLQSKNEDVLFTYLPIRWGTILLDSADRNIQMNMKLIDQQRDEDRNTESDRCMIAKCA